MNFFAVLVASYWFTGWFLLEHSSSSNMVSKIAKMPAEKSKICPRPSNMVCLFIEIYWSEWGHLKILLESVKCDFEEISNKEYVFLQYVFKLTAEKMANTIAHQETTSKSK